MALGKSGDIYVSEFHGRYYTQAKSGNLYFAANQAVATTTAGLATTYTGLCISNPTTSTVDCVLLTASVMQSVVQSVQIEAYAIAVGYNATTAVTHTAALAVHNANPAFPVGTVVADTSSTLPTAPFYALFLENTATATQNGTGFAFDLGGSILLPPGGYACWVTPAQASVAGAWFSFGWEEVAR